jgi:LysM repeat protein
MADAQYLGSLVVEIDASKEKESSIEMTISSNGKGEISASAKAEGSDKTEHLTVSIPSLEETVCDIPDEDLEQVGSVPNALFDTSPAKKFHRLPILLIVLLLAVVGIGIWFFLFWNKKADPTRTDAREMEAVQTAAPNEAPASADAAPDVEAAASPAAASTAQPDVVQTAAPNGASASTDAVQTVAVSAPAGPDAAQKAPIPVRSFKVPAKIPADGVRYTVRWGDTLWDIADVFYNDPWLTNRLARYNKISNKNVLIPGTVVYIPPKSKLY